MPTPMIMSADKTTPLAAASITVAAVSIPARRMITKIAIRPSSITVNQAHCRITRNKYDNRKQNLR